MNTAGAAAYVHKRDALVRQLAAARASGAPIELRKSTSNLFRARERRGITRLDVRRFTRVLGVDPKRMIADVEGMTNFETLVSETLPYRLLPAVSPQLKSITVGGAVSGLGIESSSFRCGLVHENIEEMEILLSDGRTVMCSPEKNAELFYGFPNSYGTLGYALRLKMKLIPARPFVRLIHERFNDLHEYFERVTGVCSQDEPDFIDGTVFKRDEIYLTTGSFVDQAPFTSDYTSMRIYYQSIRDRRADYLSAGDYIWRWDTDWFWCSKQFHAQHPAVRLLATRWLLNSRTWQRLMRLSQRLMPSAKGTESVIQDVDIPAENAAEFLDFLLDEIGVLPIWVCPFRTGSNAARYPLYQLQPDSLYINFGFWDVILSSHEPGHYNRRIEHRASALGGRKALYSTAYYDRETFWRIYNGPCYSRLKAQYDPENVFPDLYQKCVERR